MNGLVARGTMKTLGLLLREQKGQALPIAMAMLAIGSLIVVPLLNLTETALRSGMREESRLYEHYAANAGISDGIREIVAGNPSLPAVGDNWSYSIPNTNNRIVDVIISKIDQNNWKIASTATSGNGLSTELNCYVEEKHYSPNAITATSITINPSAKVNGNIQFDSSLGTLINNGTIDGQIIDRPIQWPTKEEVSFFYLEQVSGAPTYEGDLTLALTPSTIGNPYSLGPIKINGNLTINGAPTGAFRLDGTVYVTGSVSIDGVRFYQNNNTIYADGTGGINLLAGSSIYESGGIVAGYSISTLSTVASGAYSAVWALKGQVTSNCNGERSGILYSGELNTNGQVTLAAGKTFTYVEPPTNLPLPPLPGKVYKVVGWESKAQ